MTDFNVNAAWCRTILDELAAAGLRMVVASPGGRAAAMSLTIASRPDLQSLVHVDERSGAFIALGAARASGRPAAISTTSGSAIANLVPALMEAYQTRTPLVLITCDRPLNMRGTGAPQTTDQIACCAPFVVASVDLPQPADDADSLAHLRAEIRRVARFLGGGEPRGPVQINVPLRGRLDSTEVDDGWSAPPAAPAPDRGDRVAAADAPPSPEADVGRLAASAGVRPGARGLLVAGANPSLAWSEIAAFAEASGYPVVADTPSNLRRPAVPNVIVSGDILVTDDKLAATPPEVIIRVGDSPVSHFMHKFLAQQACPVLRIDGSPYPRDYPHRQVRSLEPHDADSVRALGEIARRGDDAWLKTWQTADAKVCAARARLVRQLPWGEVLAASIVCGAPFPLLHAANSMSMRHANMLCDAGAEPQRVFSNRGVNGIDGTIGTFLGEAWASGQPGLLMIGDQAVIHDLPALEATRERDISGCICIMNNGGGAIFDLLDCSRLPDYERFIRNPPVIRFESIAAAFGLEYRQVGSAEALADALAWSLERGGVQVVEVMVPARSLERDIKALFGAMRSRSAPSGAGTR